MFLSHTLANPMGEVLDPTLQLQQVDKRPRYNLVYNPILLEVMQVLVKSLHVVKRQELFLGGIWNLETCYFLKHRASIFYKTCYLPIF